MQLTLDVPPSLVKKIRALHLLLPEGAADSFEEIIIGLLDAAAKDAISEIINNQSYEEEEPSPKRKSRPELPKREEEDYETVSGLGDEDEIPGEEDYEALVPPTGGLTEEDIENDMQIKDPEHEAISEGKGGWEGYENAEDAFSSKMEIAPHSQRRDPRIQRRLDHQKRLEKTRKAKVSSLLEGEGF